jgi:hypothetical protein
MDFTIQTHFDTAWRNWWLKLAGLLMAYVLWLLVRSAQGERILTVPLAVGVTSTTSLPWRTRSMARDWWL